jgi:hypothetical protein
VQTADPAAVDLCNKKCEDCAVRGYPISAVPDKAVPAPDKAVPDKAVPDKAVPAPEETLPEATVAASADGVTQGDRGGGFRGFT